MLLLKQFHCCSLQCNTDGMFKSSRVCIWLQLYQARAQALVSRPRLFQYVCSYYRSTGRIYDAKLSSGPFLDFQKLVCSLSFCTLHGKGNPCPTPTPCAGFYKPLFWKSWPKACAKCYFVQNQSCICNPLDHWQNSDEVAALETCLDKCNWKVFALYWYLTTTSEWQCCWISKILLKDSNFGFHQRKLLWWVNNKAYIGTQQPIAYPQANHCLQPCMYTSTLTNVIIRSSCYSSHSSTIEPICYSQ